MKKTFRNGNGVLELAHSATGKEAEQLRATIRWNNVREKSAISRGKTRDAERYAANRATCQLALVSVAQKQAA